MLLDVEQSRVFKGAGRASFFQALKAAIAKLRNTAQVKTIIVAGIDTPQDYALLSLLDYQERLLTEGRLQGYCPGEGGGLVVLTREPLPYRDGNMFIRLREPTLTQETASFYSGKPCLGDGLSVAVKSQLESSRPDNITALYSSMNGEHYWSKEIGILFIRFSQHTNQRTQLQHPADCWGDIGSALRR